MGCDCVCHIPGSKVVTEDGSPCCVDNNPTRVRQTPYMVNRYPGWDEVRVSGVPPKALERPDSESDEVRMNRPPW